MIYRTPVHSVTLHSKGLWKGFELEVKERLATLIGGRPLGRPTITVGGTW
jgi:hypothetical protein